MRETDLSTARSSRRTEIRSKEVKSPTRARFPPSTGNKLPHHVYTQVKEWFELMTVPAADRKPDFLDGFTYTHKKPEVKVVYRDKPETQKHQRRITNRSGSGSSKSTGRNARRRKRNSRGSKSRSRSRSRDRKIPSRSRSRDHKIQGKPTHGRSAARRSRRRSRSTSGGGSRRSKRSSSFSSTSPITGSRYSMDCSSTDDDDKRKAQKRSIHESKDYIVIKDKNTEPEFEE